MSSVRISPPTLIPFLPSQFAPLNPLLRLSKSGNEEGNGLTDNALAFSQTAPNSFQPVHFVFLHTQPSTLTPPPLQFNLSSLWFLLQPPLEPPLSPSFTSHLLLSAALLTPSLSPDNRSLGSVKAHQLSKPAS
ncbi:hypothetical protein fugu_018863 [Takifugu bimaculatus]|uniref:Uncharacterized protein n=1 Tax=Takifugu bimaculatus TaxID=433685 RepID=A0A4Z2BHJ9_9TELE|nr:hypothetical protein fugu_018863 [Takifugu bimaculatus]